MGRRQVLIPPPRPARRPIQRAEIDEDAILLTREDAIRLGALRRAFDEIGHLLSVADRLELERQFRLARPLDVATWMRRAVAELGRGAA